MTRSINEATLLGHLGRDPEVRNTQAGDKVVTFSMATSNSWTDKKTGEHRETTEWHQVVIFNPNLADVAEEYLYKGSRVLVRGKLKTRKWADKKKIERYTTEVVLERFGGELVLLDGPPDTTETEEASGTSLPDNTSIPEEDPGSEDAAGGEDLG